MRPGDLITIRVDEPNGPWTSRAAVIVELHDGGFIRVLVGGRLVWIPDTFVSWKCP